MAWRSSSMTRSLPVFLMSRMAYRGMRGGSLCGDAGLHASAARSVKVKAMIWHGSAPSSMSDATRREIASVFPAPVQAVTWR